MVTHMHSLFTIFKLKQLDITNFFLKIILLNKYYLLLAAVFKDRNKIKSSILHLNVRLLNYNKTFKFLLFFFWDWSFKLVCFILS